MFNATATGFDLDIPIKLRAEQSRFGVFPFFALRSQSKQLIMTITTENEQSLSAHDGGEIKTEDKLSRWYRYKAAADWILGCDPLNYAQILGLKESVIEKDAFRVFGVISNLLTLEGNPSEKHYVLAQKAHDRKVHLKPGRCCTDQFQGCGPRLSRLGSI